MPVRTVAVEEDGVVTDVSDYTDCSSTDEDILKVGLSPPTPCYIIPHTAERTNTDRALADALYYDSCNNNYGVYR